MTAIPPIPEPPHWVLVGGIGGVGESVPIPARAEDRVQDAAGILVRVRGELHEILNRVRGSQPQAGLSELTETAAPPHLLERLDSLQRLSHEVATLVSELASYL